MTAEPGDSVPGQLDAIRNRIGLVENELHAVSARLESEEGARMKLASTLEGVAQQQRVIETSLAENTVLTRMALTLARESGEKVDKAVDKIGSAADTLTALHHGKIWMGVNRTLATWVVGIVGGIAAILAFWDRLSQFFK